MSRIFNFSAGPATLPVPVLERARDEFVEYQGTGMSLVEASHRGKAYDQVHYEAMGLFKVEQIPCNLNHCHVHAKTDPEIRHFMLSCIFCRNNLSFNPP